MNEHVPAVAGDALDWLHERGKRRSEEVPEFDVEETLRKVGAAGQLPVPGRAEDERGPESGFKHLGQARPGEWLREGIPGFLADAMGRSRAKNAVTPPIMILTGPGGYGKTELLADLANTYRGRAPAVLLDFAENPDAATPVHVMVVIGGKLGEPVRGVGSARFPLLGMGIIAVTLRGDGAGSLPDQLAERLRGGGELPGSGIKSLASNAARLLPPNGQQALVEEGGAVVGWLVDRVRGRLLARQLDWYARSGNPGTGDGSGYGALLALRDSWADSQDAEDAETRRAARLDVWRVLCRALLADLRAFPEAGLTHGERTTNCLLLLDNADAPAGREFLETLAETRLRATDGADPLVVVAAHGERPALQPAVGQARDSSDAGLRYQQWLSAAQDSDATVAPWYPVRLAELSLGHVREIVSSHVLRKADDDAKFIHAVTGGHPGAVRELARALAAVPDPLPADFDLRALVGRPLEDTLLGMVRRRPSLSDDDLAAMAVFGLTLRPRLEAGDRVFRSLTWVSAQAIDVSERFRDLMWLHAEDSFEIRPLYRWLLARWLARDGSRWDDAHGRFVDYYRTGQGNDPVAMRYHQLALTTMSSLDNLHRVADYLAGQFKRVPDDLAAGEWNEMLAAITTAPNRLAEADADRQRMGEAPLLHRDPRDVVRSMDRAGRQEEPLGIITRLVAARWLHNDLLFDPERKTAFLLEREYQELARMTTGDAEVFYTEANAHRMFVRE